MDRRDFLSGGTSTALAASWMPSCNLLREAITEASQITLHSNGFNSAVSRHRFGVNYTPSHNWWFCWNDWNATPIKQDLDAIAALGADHLRLMLIWPFFQPNLTWVSTAHLERLGQLLEIMVERNLDALITVFTGQLSGWYFLPPFNRPDPAIFTAPDIWKAQELLIRALAHTMSQHANILGFDFGNEMNTCWHAETSVGDAWMTKMFRLMSEACPSGIHVNGVDHHPWFEPATFSARALAANPFPVIHAYPYWSEALKYGGPMDPPSTRILSAFAALVRSYARDSRKPVWAGEFNTCIESLSEKQQAQWLERAVTSAIESGVSWFSYWDSHDVDRKFAFNTLEYSLGLLTNDGKLKEQGRVFKQLATAYRGKPVKFPTATPPPPPALQSFDRTWRWLLEFLEWKPKEA
jgi:hypothetical protein